jgi:hypothetical protein
MIFKQPLIFCPKTNNGRLVPQTAAYAAQKVEITDFFA